MKLRSVFKKYGYEATGKKVTVHILDETHKLDEIVFQRGNQTFPHGDCEFTNVRDLLNRYGDYSADYCIHWKSGVPPTVIYASNYGD